MIIYENTARGFMDDVDNDEIVEKMIARFRIMRHGTVSPNEQRSWQNSLSFMNNRVRRAHVPDDCGILLEYNLPGTGKRIDFLISGHDEENNKNFIIVELKQWESAQAVEGLNYTVRTFLGGGVRETTHPAYQAFSYKQYMKDMSTALENTDLIPFSCAYLHNYKENHPEPLLSDQYSTICQDTPVFFKDDTKKLEAFIKKHVGHGKGMDILYQIENGKIKPARQFVDYITGLFQGNRVFTLLDEQQIAYDQIMKYATTATKRTTIIVNGGPGTGKSVVAVNALVHLMQQGLNVMYVAPNAAFKEALVDELASHKVEKKGRLKKIFTGSAGFYNDDSEVFDVLIVDEAHRLKAKGAFMYRGDSQVDDIIRASRVNVFFIDDAQRIRPDDEGTVDLIETMARHRNSDIIKVHLSAQFRCSGEDGFINWIDDVLQIQKTANFDSWNNKNYDVRLFDSPNELADAINEKNKEGYDARIVAGFAWPWTSIADGNSDAQIPDVSMPEYSFAKPWNSHKNQYTWAIDPDKKDQIGCVHTIQGQEKDYIGVIIGNDLRYDPDTGRLEADASNYFDASGKKGLKEKPEELTRLIKNIYKVLLTRGTLGCYIFCRDKNLQKYFKERLDIARKSESNN